MSIMTLALRNARMKAGRGVLITIVLTAMLISGVVNIGVCLQQSYLRTLVNEHGDVHAKFSHLTLKQMEFLKNRVEVERSILAIAPDGYGCPAPDSPIRVYAQSAAPLENDPSLALTDGHEPLNEDEVVMMSSTADLLGIEPKVGTRFTLYFYRDGNAAPEAVSFVMSGLLKDNIAWVARSIHNIIVSEAFALSRVDLPLTYEGGTDSGDLAALSIRYRPGLDAHETTRNLAALAGITNERDARVNEAYLAATMALPSVFLPVLLILALFMLMGALVIYNIFNIGLMKRTRQTGLLAVIGASRAQMLSCAVLEALIQTLLALPPGLLLGAGLTYVSVNGVLKFIMPGTELVLTYAPAAFVLAALVTILTVFLSVIVPALRASRIAPVDAVRFSGEAAARMRRKHYDQLNLSRLSRINLWRNRGRTVITILSLTLCGMLFIAVSTVGDSMLAGVEELARREMAGDMQVTFAYDPAMPEGTLNRAFMERVSAIDGVTAVHEIDTCHLLSEDVEDEDGPIMDTLILGYDESLMGEQLARTIQGAPTLDDLRQPGNALEILGMEDDVRIGDDVTLYKHTWDEASEQSIATPVALHVVGAVQYDDLRASSGWLSMYNFVMLSDTLSEITPDVEFTRLAIDVDPERHDQVASAIQEMCQGNDFLQFMSLREAIEQQRNSMLGMLMLLYAIIAILGLVGFLNLANTTLVGVEQRRVELGVLSALGLGGMELKKLLWSESRLIVFACTVGSLALGSALGYAGTRALNNIGATYIRFTLPLWQAGLLTALLYLIPLGITTRASKQLAKEGTVALIGQA